MAKVENYTVAATESLRAQYAEGVSVDELATAFGKSRRSVIAKLTREGVYVAPVKAPVATKDEGPTKKELVAVLLTIAPAFPVDGLMNATKGAIAEVIELARAAQAA